MMDNELLSSILVFLGLVPIFISACYKETRYVFFWDAFWNLYGLIIVIVGLVVAAEGIMLFILVTLIVLCVLLLLLSQMNRSYGPYVKKFGASALVFPVAVGLILMTYFDAFVLGLYAMAIAFLSILLLKTMRNKGGSRRRIKT